MTARQFISVMILATLVCWASFFFVLFNIDPFTDAGMGHIFFYLTIFCSILGTSVLAMFTAYHWFSKPDVSVFHMANKSFLFSLLLAGILTLLLFLQAKAVLHIWNFGIFVAIIIFFLLFRFSVLMAKRKER